jgi:hypothetical protein
VAGSAARGTPRIELAVARHAIVIPPENGVGDSRANVFVVAQHVSNRVRHRPRLLLRRQYSGNSLTTIRLARCRLSRSSCSSHGGRHREFHSANTTSASSSVEYEAARKPTAHAKNVDVSVFAGQLSQERGTAALARGVDSARPGNAAEPGWDARPESACVLTCRAVRIPNKNRLARKKPTSGQDGDTLSRRRHHHANGVSHAVIEPPGSPRPCVVPRGARVSADVS